MADEIAREGQRDDYIHQALAAIGGEDTEFVLTAPDAAASGAFGHATVKLNCRYQGCEWGLLVGEMELWEFITDAREHWEGEHADPVREDDDHGR